MNDHLNEKKQFVSDRHPTIGPNKLVLSLQDELAQDLIYEYSTRTKENDLATGLQMALEELGFDETKRLIKNDKVVEAINAIQAVYEDTMNVQAKQIERLKKQLAELQTLKDNVRTSADITDKVTGHNLKFDRSKPVETQPEFVIDEQGRAIVTTVDPAKPNSEFEVIETRINGKVVKLSVRGLSETSIEVKCLDPSVTLIEYKDEVSKPEAPKPYVMTDAEKWANQKFLATARETVGTTRKVNSPIDAMNQDFADIEDK